jgi:hypothetical protein
VACRVHNRVNASSSRRFPPSGWPLEPADPLTLSATVLVLLAVAVAAAYVSALRAE